MKPDVRQAIQEFGREIGSLVGRQLQRILKQLV